jgi:hypothetical protein
VKSLRLALAAAAVAAVVAPVSANAGAGCTIYRADYNVGPVTIHDFPHCAW